MATIKKLFVRFDFTKKVPFSGDFLIPRYEQGSVVIRGIKSGVVAEYGMLVYLGVGIKENDLFAKLVDSGAFIENVEETLACLRNYVEQVSSFKIGNVARLIPTDGCKYGLGLGLVANTPSTITE